MARSLSIPYYPNPTPEKSEDLQRYLQDEFQRIRAALIAQPVAMTVSESNTVDVTTSPNWQQLFIGEPAQWEVPGGAWDPVTGIWTCQQQGLYSAGIQMEVQPFGSGNKAYYAGVAMEVNSGGAITRREFTDGGDDAVPLGVIAAGLIPLRQGDQVTAEKTVVHDQFVGIADYNAAMQILNVSN